MSIGRDAAFIGANENQFAILDDDKTGLVLYILPGKNSQENDNEKVLEENHTTDTNNNSFRGPMPFMFETEVDRIFSTPLGNCVDIFYSCFILSVTLVPLMLHYADTDHCICRVNINVCISWGPDRLGKTGSGTSEFDS